jgi:hypothetical protein
LIFEFIILILNNMTKIKQNCWEFMKCGRGPKGKKAGKMGVCPAAAEKRLDKVHDGINSGRACWAVAGHSPGNFSQEAVCLQTMRFL